MEEEDFPINNSSMIVRVGFVVAASIAAFAVKQLNVKNSKSSTSLAKSSGTRVCNFSVIQYLAIVIDKRKIALFTN